MVKNPPANAGDGIGFLIREGPALLRATAEPGLQSPEPQLRKRLPTACAPRKGSLSTATGRAPFAATREKLMQL